MVGIKVEGLTKEFDSLVAVDHLSFEIKEGEVFGLLGPNGAGKTTTIRLLGCLISPSEGTATVGGYDIIQHPVQVREKVGILTETPSLYERLTALENMDFFAEAYGLTNPQAKRERIGELLRFFELWDRRGDKVATFSKGMKQKLAIARALVHRPPFLFLDEPTAGLDPEASKEVRDLMKVLSHQERHTILLCTHHLADAERLCHRVMIINKGRSVITGTPDQLGAKIAGNPTLQVTIKEVTPRILEAVKAVKGVTGVNPEFSSTLEINLCQPQSTIPQVVKTIVESGGEVLEVRSMRPSLEEAYIQLMREDR
ncbi:MAG: ABC transporter ATP-binding protein [Thermoproteota archaeon]